MFVQKFECLLLQNVIVTQCCKVLNECKERVEAHGSCFSEKDPIH